MAVTWTSLGTFSDPGPSGSVILSNVSAPIGAFLWVAIAIANSGSSGVAVSTTSSDNATGGSNTWVQATKINRTPGSVANDGVTMAIFYSILVRALVSKTITVALSPSSGQGVTIVGEKAEPDAGEVPSFIGAGAGASGASNAPSITTGSLAVDDVVIGVLGIFSNATVTGDADTTNGSWSSQIGVTNLGANFRQVRAQRKTVTGAGTQTYNPTIGSSQQYAMNYITMNFSAAISGQPYAKRIGGVPHMRLNKNVWRVIDGLLLPVRGGLLLPKGLIHG